MPWSWLEKPYAFAAVATATGLILLPKSVTPILFRAQSGPPMTIHFSRVEPPKEAFDDIFVVPAELEQKNPETKGAPTTNLNLSSSENTNWNPLVDLNRRHVVLPSVEFTRQMVAIENEKERQDMAWVEQLTPIQRQRLQAANEKNDVLSKNWSIPTWREFANKKISQTETELQQQQKAAPNKVAVSDPSRFAFDGQKTARTSPAVEVTAVQPTKIALRGLVRLSPGLALGDRSLEIRRFVDGIPRESGTINPKAGTFSITTEDLQGSISVELFDKSGVIVASGTHRLTTEDASTPLEISVAAKSQFAGNFVNFDRAPSRLIADKVTSTRGQPAEILYASLGVHDQTDALGSFAYPKISESSFGLIRAQAKGFAESIYVVGAGEGKNLPLMPSSLIAALQNLTKDPSSVEETLHGQPNAGLVWGQVVFDGKPMSGVSVAIEQDPEAQPVYLNGFIPIDTLQMTTENGYFVFPALQTGMHSLIATRNGEYVGHINVQVDEGAVSVGVIEATTKIQAVQLKVYDAFEGSAQEANVQMQSLQQGLQVLGQAEVSLQNIQRLSLGYVQPELPEYLPTQIVYSDSEEYVHIPLVRIAWLEQLSTQRRISFSSDVGTVIGFVPEDDFEPYLSHEDKYDPSNIVYFNQQGQVVEKGVAGGGFVMFNVPVSTQSIVVLSKKTEMLSTQVVPVDVNSHTIIKFRF
jgi:hypothetical protein